MEFDDNDKQHVGSRSLISFRIILGSYIHMKPITNTQTKDISIRTFCLNSCTHNMKLFSLKDVKVLDTGHR